MYIHVYIYMYICIYMYMYTHCTCMYNCTCVCSACIPYSGYFSGSKIFVSSEFLASSWKIFHGHSIHVHVHVLCHTLYPVPHSCSTCVNAKLCSTVSWVNFSWFASQPHYNSSKGYRRAIKGLPCTLTCRYMYVHEQSNT